MKFRKKILPVFAVISAVLLLGGWGSVGHKLINTNTVYMFPYSMSFLSSWKDSIALHASDADNRKSSDPTEDTKHFIDIDNYNEFNLTGHISQSYDSVVAAHGSSFVVNEGILPWTIVIKCDSLKNTFKRKDWHKAMLFAADLGHYVGDAHMPLHIARNYNGQYTNQSGVHSRYETTLIGKYSTLIYFTKDSAKYVQNISDYTFALIYSNYKYVDSVLKADSAAKAFTGSTSSAAYQQKFWDLASGFTNLLFNKAAIRLADLIYTCWVNAGSPTLINSVGYSNSNIQDKFYLAQNFPNPFNPSTTISFSLKNKKNVSLKVFDITGKEITTLINSELQAGEYSVVFDAPELSSGVYFYRLQADDYSETKKFILLR